jgi:hypothetical protein
MGPLIIEGYGGWCVEPGTGFDTGVVLPWLRLRHPAVCGSRHPSVGYACSRSVWHRQRHAASLPVPTRGGRMVIAVWR